MPCTSPRTVGFQSDGKTIAWSPKHYNKEFPIFQLPCGKCLECRLDYARQWAVRCVHEARMHEKNCFITLTYDEKNLESPKLRYLDFQLFVKKLRDKIFKDDVKARFGPDYWSSLTSEQKKEFRKEHKEYYERQRISIFVTGEYGDENKRPHWHACIFNWEPSDGRLEGKQEHGSSTYTSADLSSLWAKGRCNYGSVTFQSAGYVARYAAKKLIHGSDQDHDYHPISKKSAKNAIGKRYLEKYWADVFSQGHVVMEDGSTLPIPRYYEKWLQKNRPEDWAKYVTTVKQKRIESASKRADIDRTEEIRVNSERRCKGKLTHQRTRNEARRAILRQKFKLLQDNLKL